MMLKVIEEWAQGEIVLSLDGAVALIEMNRPEQFNALTLQSLEGLEQALRSVNEDQRIHAAVVTGRGRAFSAGIDLKVLAEDDTLMADPQFLGPASPVMAAFRDCSKPIIAAVNGVAVTGGLELALACDFIYAASSARFADTHARVGLVPGWGLSQKLPRLVGINRAREISFTGNYFSASDGLAWGLVNRVVEDEALIAEAMDTGRQIASCLPDALYRIKGMMNEGWESSLGEALEQEGRAATAYNGQVDVSGMAERLAQLKQRSKSAAKG